MSQQPAILLATTSGIGVGTAVGPVLTGFARYSGVVAFLNVTAVPAGGSPTLSCFLQMSPDGGTTWQDIGSFQFGGSTGTKTMPISQVAAGPGTAPTPSDGALASGTLVQGPFGDAFRLKYTMALGGGAGTYTLAASLQGIGPAN
jgi:hypothetical protein